MWCIIQTVMPSVVYGNMEPFVTLFSNPFPLLPSPHLPLNSHALITLFTNKYRESRLV